MDIELTNFILNKTKNNKKYYLQLHNTISTSYSGDIRCVMLCNLTDEAKENTKGLNKMYVNRAKGFISVSLINARPMPILVFNEIELGEWKDECINNN